MKFLVIGFFCFAPCPCSYLLASMENEGHAEQQEVADIPEARVRSISFSILTEAEAVSIH